MKKRILKKLVKYSSQFLDITIKWESEEDGNRVFVTHHDKIRFNRYGMTSYYKNIPIWYIPYVRVGNIKSVKPFAC